MSQAEKCAPVICRSSPISAREFVATPCLELKPELKHEFCFFSVPFVVTLRSESEKSVQN